MALLAPAEALLCPSPAIAHEATYRFDIPAGTLTSALSAFSAATGLSVGWSGTLPARATRPLRGTMTAPEALRRILSGSGLQAVHAGNSYRIVTWQRPPQTAPAPPLRRPASPPAIVETFSDPIVVTGQKRRQVLSDVPMSMTVVPLDRDTAGRLSAGTGDLALSVDGLAVTNLGPGRNRQFIRGVADSPFSGPSQSTVAVQLDETRLTFDAPDPDLRLVDMKRVEVLKGPQGPLYGSGALGGIYHMVSVKPDLAVTSGRARVLAEAVDHGGLGVGGEAVLNLPLATDRLAVRGVAYVLRSGGWIDNLGRNQNANRTKTDGGRLALRWTPDADWTIDLSGVLQQINPKDSQYVTASNGTVRRRARIPEPADNDFKAVAATVEGRIGGLKMLATGSYVDHDVNYTLDATDASQSFGLSGVSRFVDDRRYTLLNGEVRVSPRDSSNWIAGLSYMRAESFGTATVASADKTVVAESLSRDVTELSAFGEASLRLAADLKATAGVRLSRSIAEDQAPEWAGGGAAGKVSKTIASPSLSLAWTPSARSLVYLRYARATRPGGLVLANQAETQRFAADELGSFDLGFRHTAGRDLSFAASAFFTLWTDIQSDYLLDNGLVSTRNAGKGRILGLEASADWHAFDGFTLSAGASFIDAKLVRTADGIQLKDRSLPVTPDLSGRLSARYLFALGDWAADLSAQANYVGSARLTFDETLDRAMGDYVTASAGAVLTRGRLSLGARVDNLFDIKGDSFAFGNPFSIMAARQYTPLRPRTFSLSVSRSW